MHTLRLLLDTTAYDEEFIGKVYDSIADVHNAVVRHAKKLLRMLNRNKRYHYAKKHYGMANEAITKAEKTLTDLQKELESLKGTKERNRKREIRELLKAKKVEIADRTTEQKRFSEEMNEVTTELCLTKNDLEKYASYFTKKYKGILNSQQIQAEADRVWAGVEKVLFGSGKDVHYKKYVDFKTIRGKQNTTGIRFCKETLSIQWNGHDILIAYKDKLEAAAVNGTKDKDLLYKMESLSGTIKYCELLRLEFKDGYHYYVNLYIDGPAPKKLVPGKESCGIDQGVSTEAAVMGKHLVLEELAPNYKKYDKKIFKLQRKAEAIRRKLNPEYYNPDGTIKKMPGIKRKWKTSDAYEAIMRAIRVNYRKKTAYTKQSHEELCNRFLSNANVFYVENMNFPALAKRAKETSRSDRTRKIVKPDGTVKTVVLLKRKKRFGTSVNSRSPGLFLTILQKKCDQYELLYYTTDAKTMKASQYDHTSGECVKHTLKDRFITLSDGTKVQRDLYSAFLHRHVKDDLKHPDREACIRDFPAFKKCHDELIERMKREHRSMKQCFGF